MRNEPGNLTVRDTPTARIRSNWFLSFIGKKRIGAGLGATLGQCRN